MKKSKYVQGPLNYSGNKFKLLPQILPHFPSNIRVFMDVFCGSCTVGLNVKAEHYIFNDTIAPIVNLYKFFQQSEYGDILRWIGMVQDTFELSKENQEGFLELRKVYNNNSCNIYLYVLLCYCFNNQFRVNSKGEFNTPFGRNRSEFNQRLQDRLKTFCTFLEDNEVSFQNYDYMSKHMGYEKLRSETDFVYLDPPYFISTATYNENKGWTEMHEHLLYSLMNKLTDMGVRWALSNVTHHKGLENLLLLEYISQHPELEVVEINANYKHSSYNKKNKSDTREVLLKNY